LLDNKLLGNFLKGILTCNSTWWKVLKAVLTLMGILTMVWSCHSTDEVGYYDKVRGQIVGMPYTWLHSDDLSPNGYDAGLQ